jgi:hypothetical protein
VVSWDLEIYLLLFSGGGWGEGEAASNSGGGIVGFK